MRDFDEMGQLGLGGVTLATLVGFDEAGHSEIALKAGVPGVRAETLVQLDPAVIGARVAIVPLEGDVAPYLILGVLQKPLTVAEIDGAREVLSAEERLVLRCGKASVTLNKDGRITVRGTQLLSRAEGANRIQGGSVQLN